MQMAVEMHASGAGRRGGKDWRWWTYGVAFEPRTWLGLLYLLLSFPVGLFAFIALVTLLATGGGLAVTLVGIPLLIATMYAWCAFADLDRAVTNVLLQLDVPQLPFDDRFAGRPWDWARIRARLANWCTWRSLVYLLVRGPLGVAAFCVVAVLFAAPLAAFATPTYFKFGGGPEVGPGWRIDTWPEALAVSAAAIPAFVIGLHLLRATAWVCGAWTATILGGRRAKGADRPEDDGPTHGDAFDVLTWRGLRLTGTIDTHRAQLQRAQVRAFQWHLLASATVMAVLAVINALTGHGPWLLWPAWGIAIPLAIHAGYLVYGWLGAHAGLFAAVNAGLWAIDLTYSNNYWFYWPLLGWGLFLVACTAGSVALRRRPRRAMAPRAALAAPAGDGGGSAIAVPVVERAPDVPGLSLDVEMRRVLVDGHEVQLTPKEFDVLVLLYENPGRPFSRGELLDRVWKNEYEVTDRTVDACVMRLRKKLAERSESIQTVWGIGYRYQP